ncbi:MAG TPA: YlxR family protein [Acidimicrobiia bacterium]|nr:YlxR family protein [Acidimicrobiia bacterium]
MCVGCRRRSPMDDLVRLFRAPDGTLGIGAGSGRGAWLCAPPSGPRCLDLARERRALDSALRTEIPGAHLDDVRARLERPESAFHDGARHPVDRFDRAETAHVGSQEDSDL